MSAFEEQVQLLTNQEVDILNCWEPAVREANLKLGDGTTRYAYTNEGYFKWGHGAYIASQAKSRGNLDSDLQGAELLPRRRISRAAGPRPRLCRPEHGSRREYATENGWTAEDIASLKATKQKVARKFTKPFVSTTTPSNSSAIEEEWQRFLNA